MRLCLFEDRAEQFEPLTWTRPIFELRCGLTTLGQKQLRHVEAPAWGVLVRPELEDLYRQQHPGVAVNDAHWLAAGELILVNGRWLPPETRFVAPRESCIGTVGAEIAYVVLKKNELPTIVLDQLPNLLELWARTLPRRAAGGHMASYPWDLVERNAEEVRRDFGWLRPVGETLHTESLAVIGPRGQLWVAPSARIEPMVVIDTTRGPVVIDENAVVSAFTRLEGPCAIGPGTRVFGAKIRSGTTLGPQCRIGGEIEASIVHGHANKYHEGFLGHSYVGEWVNLGAGTHNSDLRNDYGDVSVVMAGATVATGMSKVGCFLGDHTKTGLGTLLNTGTNVGAFCNALPAGRFAPKYMPSFTTWWNGSLREAVPLEQTLATARRVMLRRGVALTDTHETLYAWLLDETAEERRRIMRESEQALLRRSA